MLFREDMTYPEALMTFFEAIEGKTKKEMEGIQKEFEKIIPAITKKELDGEPVLTSYKL